jgi:hypothetical protein
VWSATGLLGRVRPFGRGAVASAYLDRTHLVASAYLAARGVLAPRAIARVLAGDLVAEAQRTFDPTEYVERRALRAPWPAAGDARASSARAARARALAALDLTMPVMSGALREADGAAATHGLALKLPFFDHRLFEWTANGGRAGTPSLLRDILGAAIPQHLLKRSTAAPRPPIDAWLRGPMRPWVETRLLADDPEGLFAPGGIAELWKRFLDGRVGHRPVWSLAVLRAWIAARRRRLRGAVSRPDSQHAA